MPRKSKTTTTTIISLSYYNIPDDDYFLAPLSKRPIEVVPMKIYETAPLTTVVTANVPVTVTTTTTTATKISPNGGNPTTTSTSTTTPSSNSRIQPPVEYYNIIDENIIPEDPKTNAENLKLIQQILDDLKDFLETHKKQQHQHQQQYHHLYHNHQQHQIIAPDIYENVGYVRNDGSPIEDSLTKNTPSNNQNTTTSTSNNKAFANLNSLFNLNPSGERKYSEEFSKKFDLSPVEINGHDRGKLISTSFCAS